MMLSVVLSRTIRAKACGGITGYLSNSSYCARCLPRCRPPPPPPFFLAIVTNTAECILLQHLPDYNTWVKIAPKSACSDELWGGENTRVQALKTVSSQAWHFA